MVRKDTNGEPPAQRKHTNKHKRHEESTRHESPHASTSASLVVFSCGKAAQSPTSPPIQHNSLQAPYFKQCGHCLDTTVHPSSWSSICKPGGAGGLQISIACTIRQSCIHRRTSHAADGCSAPVQGDIVQYSTCTELKNPERGTAAA